MSDRDLEDFRFEFPSAMEAMVQPNQSHRGVINIQLEGGVLFWYSAAASKLAGSSLYPLLLMAMFGVAQIRTMYLSFM